MQRNLVGRWVLLALLAGILIAWYALDLGTYVGFDALNANKARLQVLVAEHPVPSVGLFVAAYVLVTAFSLPVATAMTLLSGVLFGRWFGTLWVNIAATSGATLACLAARYVLRDWVQERFRGERLDAINRGIAENGLNFLLFLRLVPLFPFFLINLAAGLTVLPLRTFFFGTMVGTLPGTFVYVNAGHEVSSIAKPADVVSPGLLLSFTLLGLFALAPLVYKRWKRRREAGAEEAPTGHSPRPRSAWQGVSLKLHWLMLRFIYGLILGEMVLQTLRGPWWWWRRRTGHGAEVDAAVERIAGAWSRRMLRMFHCEVRVEGLEHLPRTGPVIIAANHQSLYDIPVCMGFLGRQMGFVAKKELFRIPGLAWWMRQAHCARIDREDIAGGGKLLEELSRRIQERGYCMIIFPEGTRSRRPDADIGPFKRGSLRLAQAHAIPVVPLSIDGTRFLVSPAHMAATRGGGRVVRLKLAPARMPKPDASAPENKRFMDELRDTIVSNRESIRVSWPNT